MRERITIRSVGGVKGEGGTGDVVDITAHLLVVGNGRAPISNSEVLVISRCVSWLWDLHTRAVV